MKIRLTLALLLVLGLGTSAYYTHNAPATNATSGGTCCGGDPWLPAPAPTPTPTN